VMNCPACDAKAHTRSSLEIHPTFRQLYYRCTNIACGMTWVASLTFEHVLSPSGVSTEFRPPRPVKEKAPGHDYGQISIFEMLPKPSG
ncbi:MAG: ogr/Delta-like zinc finger family protein, partial [Novosphingobium sp.]